MNLDLKDRIAIVTGASRGLGEAIVKDLVDEGALVVAAARSEEALNELSLYSPDRIAVKVADMQKSDDVEAIVDFAIHRFGSLDAVVNNAGIAPAG